MKRNANAFYAVMGNLDTLEEAYKTAENAAGSAEREQLNYAQSVQYSIDRLKASMQELAYNLIDSGALKSVVEFFVSLTNAINSVTEATDGAVTVFGGLAIAGYAIASITGAFGKIASVMQKLQGLFASSTAAKVADTIATEANTKAEERNAAMKLKEAAANQAATAAQIEETASDVADTFADKGQAIDAFLSPDEWMSSFGSTSSEAGELSGALGAIISPAGAVVAILGSLAAVAVMVHGRTEDLKDDAFDLANAYSTSAKEFDSYKDQIADLNKTINSSNSSYDEAKAARDQLLSIQDSLIEKYGTEASSIDLVTKAINGQIEALDELKQREWIKTKNEFNKTKGIGFIDSIVHMNHGAKDNVGVMKDELYNATITINGTMSKEDQDFLSSIADIYGGSEGFMSVGTGTSMKTAMFSGDLDEIEDKLYSIQTLANKLDVSEALRNSITQQIQETEDTLNKYGEFAKQWTLNEEILPNENLKQQFDAMQEAYAEYQDTLIQKYDSDEARDEAVNNAKSAITDVMQAVRDSGAKEEVLDYFREMYPDIQSLIGSWELELTLKTNVEEPTVDNAISAANKFSSLEAIQRAKNAKDTETAGLYAQVKAGANSYGLSVEDFVRQIKEAGKLSIDFQINESSLESFKVAAERAKVEVSKETLIGLDDIISESDYSATISGFGVAQWEEAVNEQQRLIEASKGAKSEQEALAEAVDSVAEKLENEAEAAGDLSNKISSSDLADSLVSVYDKAFQAIGKAYKDMVENDFDLSKIDLSSITAIKEATKDLQSNLSVDGIDFNTEAYEHLLDVVTNATSSSEEIKSAFDNMATAIISSLDGVNEENYKVAESFLNSRGIVDASLGAFMAYANGIDEAKAKALGLVDANGQVSGSTAGAEEALVSEMYAGQNTSDALEYLRICMLNVSLQGIDISNALSALQTLEAQARATGSSIAAINGMQKAATSYQTATNAADRKRLEGRFKLYQAAQQAQYEKDLKEIQNRQSVDWSKAGGGGGGSKGGGGGGGSKEAEKEVDVLKELSSQLDEIQAAYSSLNDIVEAYNQNGKLTIDQAQELINTDFRYLAMLKQENGALVLDAQGFETLARAKLQEMQIQLARNAIDAVNNLKTEADAANFLTYAYEGLAGAALDATEAQLQLAVATQKANGGMRAEAAQKIWEGYQATKVAIGNTDFSSSSLAGKKDSDKDKSDKDKDKKDSEKKQEDTKTKFNWLDQLVNKIQRDIDKLSKRAEKYFSYMEKNALIDKQLASNRRMIATQELAVNYYQGKTNKALKKVPKNLRSLVSGDFDPTTVKNLVQEIGSAKTEKLQQYLDWQELLEKAQDALSEAYDQERTLIGTKLDNILDYFDTLIGYQQNILKGIEASRELDTAKGLPTDMNKLVQEFQQQKEIVEKSGEREEAYEKEAKDVSKEIRQSYEKQKSTAETGYKDTAAYQKLKNKGKQGKAKSTIANGYEVLAEDAEAAIAAAKKMNKKKTAAEGKATLERLHQKYLDYLAELQKDEEEALKENQRRLEDQRQQNQNETIDAQTAMWNKMTAILEEMTAVYDRQISRLNTIITKYDSIYELLEDVDASILSTKYDVGDLFETEKYGAASQTHALRQLVKTSKEAIASYRQQYDLYGDLISAVGQGDVGARRQSILSILNRNDLTAESKKIAETIANELANNNWNGNEMVATWKSNMSSIITAIADLVKQAEKYGDELADSVTKNTKKIIDALELLQQAYAAKANLINDAWTVDINGITEYGYAKISALTEEADVARKRAMQFYNQIADIQSAKDTDYADDTERYETDLNTAIKNYYEAVQDVHSINDEIYNLAKKVAQQEVDNISKLVENYKKALNAKKAYYDYDKTLKEKNKNIQSLQSEIAALQNVGDSASKARLKALRAELEEAQEDLDDTVFNHQIQIETDALDKLVSDMTEALQDTAKTIQETFEEWSKTIKSVVEASKNVDANSIFEKVIDYDLNSTVSDTQRAKEQADASKIVAEQTQILNENQSKKDTEVAAEEAKHEENLKAIQDKYDSFIKNYTSNLARVMQEARDEANRFNAELKRIQDAGGITIEQYADPESYAQQAKSRYEAEKARVIQNYNPSITAENTRYTQAMDDIADKYDTIIAEAQRLINRYGKNGSVVSGEGETGEASVIGGSSVITDIESGVLSALDPTTQMCSDIKAGLTTVSVDVLSILEKIQNVPDMYNNMGTIQTNVVSINSNVSSIASDTAAIRKQLTNMAGSSKNNTGNSITLKGYYSNSELKQILKQLQKLGITRIYY